MNLRFEYFFERAREAAFEEKRKRAESFLNAAEKHAETLGDIKDILRMRAILADEDGNLTESEYYYRRILSMDEEDAGAWYGLGSVSDRKGDLLGAEAFYRKALAIDPDYDRAAFFLADLYDERGEWEKAIQWYEYALRKNPMDFHAHINMSAIYEKRGMLEESERHLEDAINIDPFSARAFVYLGMNKKKQGEPETARVLYERARMLDPSLEEVYLNFSALFIDQKDYLESLKYLNDGIERLPEAKKLRYNRACVLLKLGNLPLAMEELSRAIAIDACCAEWAREDSDFDEIRETPEYKKALGKE